jgi:hypothetical protein
MRDAWLASSALFISACQSSSAIARAPASSFVASQDPGFIEAFLLSPATEEKEETNDEDQSWMDQNIVFSPDRSKLASRLADETIVVFDVATGQVEHVQEGCSDLIRRLLRRTRNNLKHPETVLDGAHSTGLVKMIVGSRRRVQGPCNFHQAFGQ